jgi:tricorn protease
VASPGYPRYPHIHGDLVAFAAEDDVYLVSADGGRTYRLTSDGVQVSHPRFSPDGGQLAWTGWRDGAPEVYTSGIDGGDALRRTYWGDWLTRTAGWTAGGEILAISAARQHAPKYARAFAIGETVRELPYGPASDIAVTPGATVVLAGAVRGEPAFWKRYRGGRTGRLWVRTAAAGDAFSQILKDHPGQLGSPMIIGDRLFFLSDHEGTGNIYSCALDGTDITRHTDHEGLYVRNPATDGQRIVYHVAGQLWILDPAGEPPRPIDISLPSPPSARAPRLITAETDLGSLDTDRSGQASVVEVRGTVHWLTHKDGPARALFVDPEARARMPRILGDTVIWVTDADGDDALQAGDRRIGGGQLGSVTELAAAPDGSKAATAARDGRLLLTDIASGQVTEVVASGTSEITDLAWSPDSAWLAWSQPGERPLRTIRVLRVATGEITDITDGRFTDTEPVFTLDGKYLAFLSIRTFDPVYDVHSFDMSFPYGERPYLVTLAAGTASPFGPLAGGRPLGSQDKETGKDQEKTDDKERAVVTLDAAGIASRVVSIPAPEATYYSLRAVEGGLAWLRAPVGGVLGTGSANAGEDGQERHGPTLERFDLDKRELTAITDDLRWFDVSKDGKRLVIRTDDGLQVRPVSKANGKDECVTVDLSRARFTADPVALWRHAYTEAGRFVRRDFWDPRMSGIDWDEVLERYRPLVEQVRGPADFADLLWDLFGELGTSHAYVYPAWHGGDGPAVGQLGADISRTADGRWIVDRVLPGESSDPGARSPLRAPGVVVGAGDEIIAVDGRPLDPVYGPWPLLAGAAGKPAGLTIRSGEQTREVVVVPLRDEQRLRYQDWVAGRRRLVRELGGDRVGYLHVPDMMGLGWADFHRDLRTEMGKDAVIADMRGNSGGHISELVVEQLARRVIAWDMGRYRRPVSFPRTAPRGPVVALGDEFAGSDGDIVIAAIRSLGVGPVVGTRTWGGVIGIDGRRRLVDGTSITVPGFAFWFGEFGWQVENHGVDPDIEVLNGPGDYEAGHDPQLETAIRIALDALGDTPPATPPAIG